MKKKKYTQLGLLHMGNSSGRPDSFTVILSFSRALEFWEWTRTLTGENRWFHLMFFYQLTRQEGGKHGAISDLCLDLSDITFMSCVKSRDPMLRLVSCCHDASPERCFDIKRVDICCMGTLVFIGYGYFYP